jgi:hypothetical protein
MALEVTVVKRGTRSTGSKSSGSIGRSNEHQLAIAIAVTISEGNPADREHRLGTLGRITMSARTGQTLDGPAEGLNLIFESLDLLLLRLRRRQQHAGIAVEVDQISIAIDRGHRRAVLDNES